MTGQFVIPRDSALLLLVSYPSVQDSDLAGRDGAAHEVNIDSPCAAPVFFLSPFTSVDFADDRQFTLATNIDVIFAIRKARGSAAQMKTLMAC